MVALDSDQGSLPARTETPPRIFTTLKHMGAQSGMPAFGGHYSIRPLMRVMRARKAGVALGLENIML
jgi:hypothetical protein